MSIPLSFSPWLFFYLVFPCPDERSGQGMLSGKALWGLYKNKCLVHKISFLYHHVAFNSEEQAVGRLDDRTSSLEQKTKNTTIFSNCLLLQFKAVTPTSPITFKSVLQIWLISHVSCPLHRANPSGSGLTRSVLRVTRRKRGWMCVYAFDWSLMVGFLSWYRQHYKRFIKYSSRKNITLTRNVTPEIIV